MILSILLNLAVSIITVALIHYLWSYFRDKFTVKRTHDVIGEQTQKYKDMMAELLSPSESENMNIPTSDYLSPDEKEKMIAELRQLIIWIFGLESEPIKNWNHDIVCIRCIQYPTLKTTQQLSKQLKHGNWMYHLRWKV